MCEIVDFTLHRLRNMSIFSYHLVKTSTVAALRAIALPPRITTTPGLIHAEWMSAMTLGSAIFSPSRILPSQLVMFAQWNEESAIDHFLNETEIGKLLANGWHTRLEFMRQWGTITEFEIPNETKEIHSPDASVVAVTLARMKLLQVPRFLRWGRPVEKLVRDHPGTTLSLASIRFPRTVSTFSIWRSQKEMVDMVLGHSAVPDPKRHVNAMKERERQDFHFEFTTLRFKPISEAGQWNGQANFIPNLAKTD